VRDRLRLRQRHPAPDPERHRGQRAVDHPPALDPVGQHQRRAEVDPGLRQPRDGEPERRDPDADDGHQAAAGNAGAAALR
jgi:hypothetical protein